ncbi:MAG: threonine synthase [Mogibacterium sp.]|nr:threonine synthase [Mogibacterium sp.]
MINYISTRNSSISVKASEAVIQGQAADGGLFVPKSLDDLKIDYHKIVGGEDFNAMATAVWNLFLDDYGSEVISALVEKSYKGKFSSDKITPLVKVGDAYVLELYHGPTSAFKDVALQALPNLLTKAREMNGVKDEIMILTATSGDTGSAALSGFSGVDGTSIVVFYPDGGISETQRLQMVTDAGSNTSACAIRGNFDDAQNGVKKIFRELPRPAEGVALSSANSINIGRLVPQIVYYFSAYRQLLDMGSIKDGDLVDFVVPTGNFGNIMAGFFARSMGLPIRRLVCASNKNDVLTEFINTGHYNRLREFHKTTSPSMDILISSNLERLLYYICGEENTAAYMKQLEEKGEYQISESELDALQAIFSAECATDEEGAAAIKRVFGAEKYLMDTHTSIAWVCLDKYERATGIPSVVLSTASPYKFCASVLAALGLETSESDRDNMRICHEYTKAEIPSGLAGIWDKEILHKDIINPNDMKSYIIEKTSK